MDPAAFNIYALTAAFLAVHLVLLALWTGFVRARSGRFANPEDKGIVKGELAAEDHPDVLRVKRAHVNALENAVPFFVVGALYVATGGTKLGAEAYCGTFLAVRVLHSLFYLWGKQPFRTMSFALGVLCIFGMAVHVIRVTMLG